MYKLKILVFGLSMRDEKKNSEFYYIYQHHAGGIANG